MQAAKGGEIPYFCDFPQSAIQAVAVVKAVVRIIIWLVGITFSYLLLLIVAQAHHAIHFKNSAPVRACEGSVSHASQVEVARRV
jgi:hypothetical protein